MFDTSQIPLWYHACSSEQNTKISKKHSYVYFIKAGNTQFYKIGLSTNPKKRLVELQSSHYQKLKIQIIWDIEKSNMKPMDAESAVHNIANKFHHRGEWFKFSDQDMDGYLWNLLIDLLGYPEDMGIFSYN